MSLLAILHLDPLSLFGLVAVGLMLAFYAMEDRWRHATLFFAGACALASTYGFLQGAWPFGLVEGVWSLVAFRKWIMLPAKPSSSATPHDATDAFIDDLLQVLTQTGPTTFGLPGGDGKPCGFVQIHRKSPGRILIHRVWALSPGNGIGSQIIRLLCELADHHGVEIALRPLPFGPKPFPMEARKLHDWYRRHRFVGPTKSMLRKPSAERTDEMPVADERAVGSSAV